MFSCAINFATSTASSVDSVFYINKESQILDTDTDVLFFA